MLKLFKEPKVLKRLLWIVLAMALLFSGYFLMTERIHACEGEHCPICAMIEVTQKNILDALPDLVPAVRTVFLVVMIALHAKLRKLFQEADTPVARKVRLDR